MGGDRAGGRDEWATPVTADTAIRTHLLTLAPVTALVDTRITTGKWHQSPGLPAVRVAFTTRQPTCTCAARSTVPRGIQVDAMATEKLSGVDAKGVAHAVMDAVYGDGGRPAWRGLRTRQGICGREYCAARTPRAVHRR